MSAVVGLDPSVTLSAGRLRGGGRGTRGDHRLKQLRASL